MRALDRKLLRDLGTLKGQIVTIAVVVACGIAAYVTLQSTWSSLVYSRDSYYERFRFADVFARLERAPLSVAERIEEIPGVAVVHTRVVEQVTAPMPGMLEPATATVVSLPSHGESPLNAVFLRAGRFPEPGRDDEVVVSQPFAEAHDLVPGDRLTAVISGKRRDLQIVGLGLSPEFIFVFGGGADFAPDDKRIAVLWMDRSVLAPAFQMEGAFNDVSLRLQPGASVDRVVTRLDDILRPYGGFGAVPRARQTSHFFIQGEMQQLEQMATVVPAIFLAVAAFLLNIVLSRLIFLQRQQIAALKALGYSNRAIALHYLELTGVIVVLGAILGVALGAYLGSAMTELYTRYFRFPTLVFRMQFSVVGVAVGVSLVAGVVGALLAVKRVVALQPAEAMRPPAPLSYHRGLIDRLGIDRIIGVPAMMVLRELRRRPLRAAISSLGIACAIGIVVVGRFGADSFEYLIDVVYHQEQRGDMTVTFHEPVSRGAENELLHLPGVLDTEGLRIVPVRFRSGPRYRDATLQGIPAGAELRRVVDRRARVVELPEEGLALSRKLAEILRVRAGDTVELEVREGDRETLTLTVVDLVDDAFGLQGYMSLRALHDVLDQEVAISMAQLRVDPGEIEELTRRLKDMPVVASVTRKAVIVRRFKDQSAEMMVVMSLILSAFGGAIAIGVVYNNARVALSMRQRDLASLRVLGFSRREISSILLGELAVQMGIGIPIGLVLGRWWAEAVMTTVDPETYRFAIVVSAESYLFATGVALISGIVSALLVRRRLDHLDLIGVLKTRE